MERSNTMNGFLAFSLDFAKKMKAKGHVISDTKKLLELVGPHWDRLDDIERQVFEMKCQEENFHNTFNKKNQNVKVEMMKEVRVKLEERESDKKRLAEIREMINAANDRRELDNTIFHFIAVSSFHESSQDIFPSEIALATFSLRKGVIDDFQIRINPRQLKSEAPDEVGTDYFSVLEQIIKFIHPLKKLPIFFTNGDTLGDSAQKAQMIEAQKVMKKIFYENQEYDMMDLIKVYPISELFYVIHRTVVANNNLHSRRVELSFPSLIAASNKFYTVGHDLAIQGCDFHDNIDPTQHCCLSQVRRFGYQMTKLMPNLCSYTKRSELK